MIIKQKMKPIFSRLFKLAHFFLIAFFITGFLLYIFSQIFLFGAVVKIEPNQHFFMQPTEITLSSSLTGEIRFTKDGTEPSSYSMLYTQPLLLSQTTSLRFALFQGKKKITDTYAHDIFIQEEHTLPVVSIMTDPENLWNQNTGIYTNYKKKGKEWQRPAQLSFYEADGSLGFQKDIGLRLHGGGSKSYPQKSFRVYASHTNSDEVINYPLFPQSSQQQFSTFILRNTGGDWEYTFMRDVLAHRLVSKSSQLDIQDSRPVVVYLNGEYWGLYYIRERQDENYFAKKYSIDTNKLSIVEVPQDVGEKRGQVRSNYGKQEDADLYNQLLRETRKCRDCMSYEGLDRQVDMQNFIDYTLFQIFFANFDWPFGNTKAWRHQVYFYDEDTPYGLDGRFRWMLFDIDSGFGFGSEDEETMIKAAKNGDYGRLIDDNFPFRNIFYNETFRENYLNRMADLLNTTLSSKSIIQEIETLHDQIAPEMPRQIARWKDYKSKFDNSIPFSYEEWEHNVDLLTVYAEHRPEAMREITSEFFETSGSSKLTLSSSNAEAGEIQLNTLYFSGDQLPWTGTYFNDNFIQLEATPTFGYRFVQWKGDVPNEFKRKKKIRIPFYRDTDVQAVFEKIISL